MSQRELVVLGTASAVPTRRRNHNGYVLRWDGQGLLFDPGEGTQRQMSHAGLAANDLHWMCITHLHGDHCLGAPGIVQRLGRDGVAHPVGVAYPANGQVYWERLRDATPYYGRPDLREHPLEGEHPTLTTSPFTLTARPLDHALPTYGYRLEEPDSRTFLLEKLKEHGIHGPAIRELSGPLLAEVTTARRGQKFAFVMDTRLCDNVYALAQDADLLVIESTYLDAETAEAHDRFHLTARQAGEIARACGVRRLVLTHFSERYTAEDDQRFLEQAGFDDTVLATDLIRVPVPRRR
ncbi:ribonuclease Z [Actinocorallia lasiicapitis]